jgi:transcriptional regulator with XRE-family HTH domain
VEPDSVAKRLERARLARGYSLKELSKLSKVPESTLSSVKTGHRQGGNLTLNTARKLAVALGISVDWLCGLWVDDQAMQWPPGMSNGFQLLPIPGGLISAT